MKNLLQSFYHVVLDGIFPERCLSCEKIIPYRSGICPACRDKICWIEKDSLSDAVFHQKLTTLFPFEYAQALMRYDAHSLSKKLIHEIKYKGRPHLAEIFIERIMLPKEQMPNLILPVPLHPKKWKERGYHQLLDFCEGVSKQYDIPLDSTSLKRIRYSLPQAQRNKKERSQISTEPKFICEKISHARHVLVIDDVFTTGATLSEVVWAVKSQNDVKVSVLVMAYEE